MRKIVLLVTFFVAALFMGGCGAAELTPEKQSSVEGKEVLYTQVSMWTEKGVVIATNYSRGELIPINSKVIIEATSSNTITFKYDDRKFVINNIPKYTKVDINALWERTFGKNKVNLSKFSSNIQKDILAGRSVIGMTKKQVLMSRGYPPAHQTLSLENDSWKYWENRFNTIVYQFKNDKLVNIMQ